MTSEIIIRRDGKSAASSTTNDLTRHLSLLIQKDTNQYLNKSNNKNDEIIRSNSFKIDNTKTSDNDNNLTFNDNTYDTVYKPPKQHSALDVNTFEKNGPNIKLSEKLFRTIPIWYLPKLDINQASAVLKDKPIGHFIITRYKLDLCNDNHVQSSSLTYTNLNLIAINECNHLIQRLIQIDNHYQQQQQQQQQYFKFTNSKRKFKSIIQLLEFYILNEPGEDISFKLTLPNEINTTFDLKKLNSLSLLEQDFWTQKRFFNKSSTITCTSNTTKTQLKKLQFEEPFHLSETKTSSFSDKYSSISTNEGTDTSTRSSNSSLYRPKNNKSLPQSILTHNSLDDSRNHKQRKPKKYLTIDSAAPHVIQTPPTPPSPPPPPPAQPPLLIADYSVGKKLKRSNSIKTASKSLDELLWPWKKSTKTTIESLKQQESNKFSKSQASLVPDKVLSNQSSKKKSRLKIFGSASTTSISSFFNSLFNRSHKNIPVVTSNVPKSIQNIEETQQENIIDDQISINSCITIKNPFFGTQKSTESTSAVCNTKQVEDEEQDSIYSSIEETSFESKQNTKKSLPKIQSFKMFKASSSHHMLDVDLRRSSSMYEPDSKNSNYRSLIGHKQKHTTSQRQTQYKRISNDYSEPFDVLSIDSQSSHVPNSNLTLNSISLIRIKTHSNTHESSKTDSQITISNDYEAVHDCLASSSTSSTPIELTMSQINRKICDKKEQRSPNESHFKSMFLDRTITFLNCESQFQTIKNYVYRLAQRSDDSLFGKSILEFINCTNSSTEPSPHIVLSNTRQFMNGMKNYLIKNGGFELRQLIELERQKLNFKTILNIDSLIEECLQNIILKPLKSKIYYLLVDHQLDDTSLMLLSTNVKKLNALDLEALITLLCISDRKEILPSEMCLSNIKFFYQRLQNEYAPLVKVKYILLIINQLLNEIQTFKCILSDPSYFINLDDFLTIFIYSLCKCGMYAIQIEMDYIWGLINRQLLNNETIFYLHLVSSACSILQQLDHHTSTITKYIQLGLLEIILPDDKCEQLTKCTIPLKANTKAKEVCLLIASRLKIFNGEDYSLYLLEENGVEKRLRDDEQPLELKNEKLKLNYKFVLVYRHQKANIVWPKNISFT